MLYFGAVAVFLAIPLLLWSLQGVRTADLRPGRLHREVLSTLQLDRATTRPGDGGSSPTGGASPPLIDAMARGGRRITPDRVVSQLEARRQLAGFGATWPMERLLALKLGAAALGTVWGVLILVRQPSAMGIVLGGLSAFLGFFGPDAWLARRGGQRQTMISRELADTIDQITICVEAGLGFDAAMARAARSGRGPLAEELRRVLQDIQVGVPRSQALDQLLQRTDVHDLRHFVIALTQAERYGVPIAQILRVQSVELREKRRAHAEEEAQKLPVKLLFPLIVCILPVLFIVLVGPAAIRISETGLGGS